MIILGIEKQEKLFEPFISKTDYLRPTLMDAFREGDYILASDGHAVIQVHKSLIASPEYYLEVDASTLHTNDKLAKASNCDEVISVRRMAAAIGKLPRFRRCPECKGKGEVRFTYYSKFDGMENWIEDCCPVCDGRGEVTHRFAVKMGDYFFTLKHLLQLRKACGVLGVWSAKWIYTSPEINIFSLSEHVKVGLMTIILSEQDEHIKNNPIIV